MPPLPGTAQHEFQQTKKSTSSISSKQRHNVSKTRHLELNRFQELE